MLSRKRIVIIDDDPAIRQLLLHLLRDEGYWVETAADGMEAFEVVNASVDLVLLDLQMPGKDGWETYQLLSCKHPELPVILITASTNQFFSAIATGIDALLEKPLDFNLLLDTIRALLEESAEAREERLEHFPMLFPYAPPRSRGTADKVD